MTDQQYLSAVESSIQFILSGNAAEYETEGRRLAYLGLQELHRIRRELQCSINRAQTGIFAVGEIRGTRKSWPGW